jgi:hypothetical protein
MMNTFHDDDREVLGFGPSIRFLLLYISELSFLGPRLYLPLGIELRQGFFNNFSQVWENQT